MEKIIKLGLLMVVFTLLVSGSPWEENVNDTSVIVHRYHYYNQDSIVKSDVMSLSRSVKNDSMEFRYTTSNQNIEECFYLFHLPIEDNSSMRIYNLSCPLVDQNDLQIFNRTYNVLKYDFDIENSSDEETSYFFCEDYGLLVVDNYASIGLIYSFEYDSISKRMVEKILLDKERYGITDYSVLPPSPIPD